VNTDQALDRHVQRRVQEERVRQNLLPRVQDPSTLDRIAHLIEAAAPQKKTRAHTTRRQVAA
jgi:hypothetical protein